MTKWTSGIDEPLVFVKGARCNVCGNGGPGSPGARYACGLPEVNRLIAGTGSKAICPFASQPKETRTMTPDQVSHAATKLASLKDIDRDIESANSSALQVTFSGRYWSADTTLGEKYTAAARVGLIKLLYQQRAMIINELRALGVEMTE